MRGTSSLKRKQPDSRSGSHSLTEHEQKIYDLIRSKQDMGISQRDLKIDAKIPDGLLTKSLKSLQGKNLIKDVKNIQNKGRKHYIAAEFEPSTEITGGAWYVEGNLDMEYINFWKDLCRKIILNEKVATLEEITDKIKRSKVSQVELSKQQIKEIVKALVLDNEVVEVKSTGAFEEFGYIPAGKVCYKCTTKGGIGGLFASIPCGVCPQIRQCTPDGIISPKTCIYYKKWLDF